MATISRDMLGPSRRGRRLAREKANGCLGWPHGSRVSASPGLVMTGIGSDVVELLERTAAVSFSRCVRPCTFTAAGLRQREREIESR